MDSKTKQQTVQMGTGKITVSEITTVSYTHLPSPRDA